MARCHTTGSRVSGSITTICVLFLQVLLGDALDVVPQHLPVTLSASLSQSLSSFATSGHVALFFVLTVEDHSPEDCPMVDIVNFRFGIFSSEPPKDL